MHVMGTREKMSDNDILAALKTVIDPELGINIVDLGLVYNVTRNANGIDIALTMTTPACPLGEMMSEEIKLVLRDRFPDLPDVRVEIVWGPPWAPELMSSVQRPSGAIVDVRAIVPRERHPLIFNTFHGLAPGQDFVLVNDHDPKPLYYHFKAEYDGTFTSDYRAHGPDAWR